ncbi:hypothetical protein EHI47_03295 [Rhizobium leguminosarum]|uniref:Tetrahydrofolate dehydrogenase/cyclohydrolase NAD(P)-binding domain-containing protein n=1 Tax=Rhizobium leguminosarum TaxID=384 RepID=A0A444IB37_RHILE|nr:hypothetical protein EHI47_03295 [Rhizobium leguminosarum]
MAAVPALFCGCLAASIWTGAITPVLGGVGPMTIMSLMHNTPKRSFHAEPSGGSAASANVTLLTRLTWLLHLTREAYVKRG